MIVHRIDINLSTNKARRKIMALKECLAISTYIGLKKYLSSFLAIYKEGRISRKESLRQLHSANLYMNELFKA